MIRIRNISTVIFILLFINALSAIAQEDCTFTLSKAQKLYDAGQIEQIPQMLQACMEGGFTKEDKIQAQKLLVLAYLFDNNQKEAENAMFSFLKKNPEYTILPSDQAEFIQLFNTYRTLPIASVGVILGSSFESINPTETRENSSGVGSYSNSGLNFHAGISYRQYIKPYLDANLEVLYTSSSYKYVNIEKPGQSEVTINETQTRIEVPISGIYKPFSFGKFDPYLRAGAGISYLLSASGDGTRISEGLEKPVNQSFSDLSTSRKSIQIWGITGVGLFYNLKGFSAMFDVRYNLNFTQQIDPSLWSRTDDDMVFLFYNNTNNFKWNNLMVTVGLFYKFYKPEKK